MSDNNSIDQNLFSEFPPVSREEWEKVISRDLKGADYKTKLRWKTTEGVAPLPFYRRDDLSDIDRSAPIPKSYSNDNANAWEVREPLFNNTVKTANRAARKALARGANALQLHLKIRRAEGALGGDLQGIPIQDQEKFSELFRDIPLDETAIHFDAAMSTPALLAMLWNHCRMQNTDTDQIRGTFTYDPFVYLLQNGQYPRGRRQLPKDLARLSRFTLENLPGIRPLAIDARTYHNSGATIIQELGFAMGAASEYLSTLTDMGIDIEDAASSLHFSFSVGSSYFLEIAKLRAFRLLWENIIEAYGADPGTNQAYLHVETSEWDKTLYDPYTNLLRTSTEGMSAAIGGCDSLTVLPFDQHFRQPDEFSQRIARNQQIILAEEAYIDKVEDPAAGSYYIEKLTDEIGQSAWELFQEVETEGGIMEAIENGTVQSAIEDSRKQRNRAIASRGRVFVGTNKYSNADEEMQENIDRKFRTVSLKETENDFTIGDQKMITDLASAFSDGARMGDIAPFLFDFGRHKFRTVNPYRGTEVFEELRLATENHDPTPTVLTLPMGKPKMRKARSTFAGNFFGSAGYDIHTPLGFDSVEEAVETISDRQPDIAVLCSSDGEYKELVPALSNALGDVDNQPILVLAGHPGEDLETYKRAGVQAFIYSGCNVLETLKNFQAELGVIKST